MAPRSDCRFVADTIVMFDTTGGMYHVNGAKAMGTPEGGAQIRFVDLFFDNLARVDELDASIYSTRDSNNT